MNVFVVGQFKAFVHSVENYPIENPYLWELSGVFPSQEDAEEACRDETYFVVGPIKMGESAPHETTLNFWNAWFPFSKFGGVNNDSAH